MGRKKTPSKNRGSMTVDSDNSTKVCDSDTLQEEKGSLAWDSPFIGKTSRLSRIALQVAIIAYACWLAVETRMHALAKYGLLIHEFDPWFNFRATEYLYENGLRKFFTWYDYMSWYPIGRPVGSTIFPGMQMTSVFIHWVLNMVGKPMSLNDVCCYAPVWFGVVATLMTGLLGYEISGSSDVGVMSAFVMSIVPAHTMRSVGGGYDNESMAMTAMVSVFYLWCRSLRDDKSSLFFGILCGISYVYMVALWGGYVFVVNMVGIHAIVLVFLGRYSFKLWRAYSLFFFIGNLGATQIPVVNSVPLKSIEQLGPLGVFFILQTLQLLEYLKVRLKIKSTADIAKLRNRMIGLFIGGTVLIMIMLYPTGYFSPVSARVRGLFLKHTRTGNPLVDSVAEHQPASSSAYFQFLHFCCYLSPIGFIMIGIKSFQKTRDVLIFAVLYAIITYFFASKMVRLIILIAPIASILTGLGISTLLNWSLNQIVGVIKGDDGRNFGEFARKSNLGPDIDSLLNQIQVVYKKTKSIRVMLAFVSIFFLISQTAGFVTYSSQIAVMMSSPSIVFEANLRDGRSVIVDDYLKAYQWLRANTPEDARIMAWWDYGYQITGIANRTSIADGNTCNHEHIATLGRCLISEENKAHEMIRHIADYVLVWAGGGGDDVAKMPHIARIANSIYSGICSDPSCSQLGFMDQQRKPSPFMLKTLVYKLHSSNINPDVTVNPKLFTNVFNSQYGRVRIWKVENVSQKSKRWIADPKNRVCDPPGSWICKGDYPPDFQKYVKQGKIFSQLEDFNKGSKN